MENENIKCESSKTVSTYNSDIDSDSIKKTKKVMFSKKNQVVFIPTRSENKNFTKNVTFFKKIIVYRIPNLNDMLLQKDLWYTSKEIKQFEKEAFKAYRIYLSKQNHEMNKIIENE